MFAVIRFLPFLCALYLIFSGVTVAEEPSTAERVPEARNPVNVLNFFKGRDPKLFDGKLIDVTDYFQKVHKNEESALPPATESELEKQQKKIVFVGDDPVKHTAPPGEDVPVRLNKEAPGPFVNMALANRSGDKVLAGAYARQYVRYLMNLMYEVRELTGMIGKALIDEGAIEEEDWDGVEQFMDFEFAQARQENGSALKATHQESMKRVVADKKGEAEVFFFFTLNCSYCRKMAPDVERLFQVAKGDNKVKMVALTLGAQPKAWVESYRTYTGLTAPILNGKELAEQFNIAFVPAVVIVSPNSNKAYMKTGLQDFESLYEFLRTVQGLPVALTPAAMKLINRPIGEVEMAQAQGKKLLWDDGEESGKKKPFRAEEAVGLQRISGPGNGYDTVDRF